MSQGERIILKDDKGKQYELIRVLDLDTEKIINDLSALVVKKDKIIDDMAEEIFELQNWVSYERSTSYKTVEDVKRLFEERCN